MAGRKGARGLQVSEDQDFQRRAWMWQRVGWVAMILIAVAAFLGLFGSGGLFDKAEVGEQNSQLWVEYNRFGRLQAETSFLRVHLGPGAAGAEDRLRFWLSRRYVEGFHVVAVTPQPEAVEVGPDRYTYVFRAPKLSQPTEVIFRLEPEELWRVRGQIGLEGGQALEFSQFIYP